MAPRIGPEPLPPDLSKGEAFAQAIPFGLAIPGKPREYLGALRALWENRGELFYARRLLKRGVCDGCSLGPAGLRDDVAAGTHLCSLRLRGLRNHTQGPLGAELLADAAPLKGADADELRVLGRIPTPLVRHRGEAGFTPLTWDEALDLAAERMKGLDPARAAWFAGDLSNEAAYTIREVSRGLGCANLDTTARFGYAASASGLADVFGAAAPTCSLGDLLGSDLVVLWGSDPSATHPVLLKYLALAKEQGSRVASVDPVRRAGLVKSWVPSLFESALWGTRILDDHYAVRKGGDIAFVNGVMKVLEERGGFDLEFLSLHAAGQDELGRGLRELSWTDLERSSGAARIEMERFANIYSSARSAVFVFSGGITRQRRAAEAVRSIATLAAVRGMVGKKRCGLLPLGGSGEQGAIDLGAVPGPGGLTAFQMIKAGQEGKLDFLCSLSGSLLDAPVDRAVVARALERTGFRIHAGRVLDPSMLVPPGDLLLLLPVAGRYETPGGCTSTSVERRIRFSPEIPGPRIAEAQPEWRIPALIARRVDLANERRFPWTDAAAVRAAIERDTPLYKGIAGLAAEGDSVQWGGERLYEKGDFSPLPGGKCRLRLEALPD